MNFNQGFIKMKEVEDNKSKSTPVAMIAPELKQNAEADTEITKTCAVLGCEDSKNLSSDSFFRFPEDPNLRQIWTDLTGRNNWTPTDFSYICMQHFSVDCFKCDFENKVVLNSKAVPSIKLPNHVLELPFDTSYDTHWTKQGSGYSYMYFLKELPVFTSKKDKKEDTLLLSKASDICELDLLHPRVHLWSGFVGFQVEYIDEETLDHEDDIQEGNNQMELVEEQNNKEIKINDSKVKLKQSEKIGTEADNVELLKLFTEVQRMQRQAIGLRDKLKCNMRVHNRQNRFLIRLKKVIEMKKNILTQKRRKKSRILLSLQDKIKEDTNGLVLAMPTKHTEDLKNFALSIYKYSPQAYIYVRNTLRTMLPSTDVLESWINSGFEPKNMLSNSNMLKVVSEQTDSQLTCKVSLH